MTRVVITGAAGMLGSDLCEAFSDLVPVCLTRDDLDITDRAAVDDAVAGADVVINAAAYTKVDDAESHEADAFAINATGAKNLAEACQAAGAVLIHVSTDYVFDGMATTAYEENAPRNPVSVYGRSKAAGEEAVLEAHPEGSVIVRTAWLYGKNGPSFPRTMLTLADTLETLRVVNDQVGQPTWTKDLAQQIRHLVDAGVKTGIFHGTNSGQTSWWGFAKEVFRAAGLDDSRVQPTTSADFVRPAPRPAWSVLGHGAWTGVGIAPMRPWQDAFAEAFPECFSEVGESPR